jgi:hypothetical protein
LINLSKEDRAMSKRTERRPEVEALESMTLLSGMAGHGVEALAKAPTFPNPLDVTGTLNGTIQTKGTKQVLTAKGNLIPIGKVSFTQTEHITTLAGGLPDLVIPHGPAKLFLSIQVTSASGSTVSGNYTVTGGTKFLTGEMGSGHVTVALSSLTISKTPTHFSATFS